MLLKLYNWSLVGCLLIFSNLLSPANCAEKAADTYLLATGRAGETRLALIDEAYGHFSRSLLESLHSSLPENAQILSIGCGTGTIECQMAQYWPNAYIKAIDSSQAQIDISRDKAASLGLKKITFIFQDANDLIYENSFDLVYARLLLIHVQDPVSVLKRMERAAKPGALIICEEISSSSFHCEPPNEFYAKAFQLTQEIAQEKKVDYDIGVKLPGYMADLGLTLVRFSRQEPDRANLNVKKQLFLSLTEAKPKLPANFDGQSLDTLLGELEKFADQDNSRISMSDLFQVVGRKTVK